MIRVQQNQLHQLQQNVAAAGSSPLANNLPNASQAIDDSTPTSERSFSLPPVAPSTVPAGSVAAGLPHRPSRARRSSQSPSPALRNLPRPPSFFGHHDSAVVSDLPSPAESHSGLPTALPRRTSRDEVSFYQAETANLTRENQMLRHRIKELEKMLTDAGRSNGSNTPPVVASSSSTPASGSEGNPPPVASTLSKEVSTEDVPENSAETKPAD